MDQPRSELSFRAVISGLFVGCLIGASNVTIGLKIGWTFGASITAAVISFAIFRAIRPARAYTPGENLISATAGSSSGTMASAGGFVAAIPALEMIRAQNGEDPLSLGALMLWAIAVAFLGVHFAVPLRRQMIVVDKLKYPTGTAAGETIKAMYASGADALKKTKVLIWTALGAATCKGLYEWGPDFLARVEYFSFDDIGLAGLAVLALPLHSVSIGFNMSPMMLGAGILIGPKVGWSLFAGAIVAWAIITPILLDRGVVEVSPNISATSERDLGEAMRRCELLARNRADEGMTTQMVVRYYIDRAIIADLTAGAEDKLAVDAAVARYAEIIGRAGLDQVQIVWAHTELLAAAGLVPAEMEPTTTISAPPITGSPYRAGFNWVLWTGVALMVTASFTSLGMQYKSVIRTFSSLRQVARSDASGEAEDEEDAPDPYPMKNWAIGMLLSTALTTIMANWLFDIPYWMGVLAVILSLLIAAIACRATGETDINPVGAMGKITQVVYGGLAPGHMQTNLMAAAITSAGASQAGDLMHDLKAGYMLKVSIRRQVITQLIGVVVGVFAAAATYRLLTMAYEIPGDKFPGPSVYAWAKMAELLAVGLDALPPGAMWGAAIGGTLGIMLPIAGKLSPGLNKWLPSPVAFGIAFMVPAQYSIGMWLGAILTYLYTRRQPERAENYGASAASGFIAGEGLMMVAIAIHIMLSQVLLG